VDEYPWRPKPVELTRLHDLAHEFFHLLRETFDVPAVFELHLYDVDAHHRHDGGEIRVVAALAMADVQALRRAAQAGAPVTNTEVVRIASALDHAVEVLAHAGRARDQAPALLRTRDHINEAARVASGLGLQVEGGIVELR
jgi:hypothetical protein